VRYRSVRYRSVRYRSVRYRGEKTMLILPKILDHIHPAQAHLRQQAPILGFRGMSVIQDLGFGV